MIVVTTPYLPGHRITESKGMVFGLVVRSRGLGGNVMASIRSLGGGEIHEYTSLLEDTRRQALDRLVQNATVLGANAVLSMRFDSSELSGTMSEIVAYGTAVVVDPRRIDVPDDAGRMSWGFGLARILVLALGLTMALARPLPHRRRGSGRLDHGPVAGRDRHRIHDRDADRASPLSLRGDRPERRADGPRRGRTHRRADRAAIPAQRRGLHRPDIEPDDARLGRSGQRRTAVRGRGVTWARAILARRVAPRPRPRHRGPTTLPMAAIDPSAPARPAVPPRPRRTTRPKATYPYINRELSWLEFNARVLHEARDERNPLLERVKFLAIFAGNLDEFFQVRVAGLRQQVEAGKVARSPDGRTAEEQLAAARARVLELVADHSAIYVSVRRALAAEGIELARLRGDPRAPRGAPPALPRRDLPGADAAGGRSRDTRSRTSRR